MENIVVKLEPDLDLCAETLSQESSLLSNNITPDVENESIPNVIELQTIKTEIEEPISEADENPGEEFCFEFDHPALKVNNDYKNLMQAISVLEAQRCKAIKDLDRLYELKEEALSDPIAFVDRLQKKEDLNVPGPQQIHPVPTIDWSKYSLTGNASSFGRRQLTRLSAKVSQDFTKCMIKGKPIGTNDQQKSQKTSQYWSVEEQKRLEELLVQFPPEEIETRRWEKIANCLENRTPIQVASRVQKYFIKLMKAGIPIPGRTPSTVYLKKPRRNVIRQQPSTFLVSHTLPVYMPEVDEDYSRKYYHPQSFEDSYKDIKMEISDDEEINPELRDTPDFQEFKLLKKILRDKLKTCGLAEHTGYKCSRCKADPIIGVRWHCVVCKAPAPVDFCDDCVDSKFEVGNHSMDHKLEEIPNASSEFLDKDYSNLMSSDYNYLDPSYMAAV